MNGNVSSGNGNLSGSQFGQMTAPPPPAPHRAQDNISDRGERTPLGLASGLGSTASRRTAWRLDGVQPYSKQTAGSTFNFNA